MEIAVGCPGRDTVAPVVIASPAGHVEQLVQRFPRPAGRGGERPERVGVPAIGQVLEDGQQVRLEAGRGRAPGLGQLRQPAFEVAGSRTSGAASSASRTTTSSGPVIPPDPAPVRHRAVTTQPSSSRNSSTNGPGPR
ncbi:hypothetical protein ABZ570_16215 [Micromonospora sp. NPDC007271]|uniref:hypothetical protein n=1 Tax=Micromonospora sp. NPDC007271 TaxID=3154587 RepID=UPI0033F6DD3D